ncbi:MAG TPA: c-type cytochrome [Chloroflexota bacterium]|nr:c-type cytochrome [Chloroflexota bacterium]
MCERSTYSLIFKPSERFALVATLVILLSILVSACSSGGGAQQPGGGTDKPAAAGAGDPQSGRTLLIEKGCGACHTVRGVPEATGSIGPNLTGVASRPKIADTLPNTPENMKRWIMNPSVVKPGTMMPPLGLSDKEASDLVSFLETLK